MENLKKLKIELGEILHYLNISPVDAYFGSISVLKTKEYVNEIINHIEENMGIDIEEIKLLIAPTGDIQEISIDNGWGEEFIKISEKIDMIIKKL